MDVILRDSSTKETNENVISNLDSFGNQKIRFALHSSGQEEENYTNIEKISYSNIGQPKELILPHRAANFDLEEVMIKHNFYPLENNGRAFLCKTNDSPSIQPKPFEDPCQNVPLVVRFLPVKKLTVIMKVTELTKLRISELTSDSELFEKGKTLQVPIPYLPQLDLRFTESLDVSPFFNEGYNSVSEGTIPSIQSARIYGGDESIIENKFGYAGDCWSEFRYSFQEQFLKSLTNPFTTQPRIDFANINKTVKISKPPSIIE